MTFKLNRIRFLTSKWELIGRVIRMPFNETSRYISKYIIVNVTLDGLLIKIWLITH